jgi:hypothetical protein
MFEEPTARADAASATDVADQAAVCSIRTSKFTSKFHRRAFGRGALRPTAAQIAALSLLAIAAAVAVPATASATSFNWTGKGDGNSWGDAHNWSPQSEPQSGDDVTIARLPTGPAHVTVPGVKDLGHLSIDEGATMTGGSMHLAGGLSWSGGTLATSVTVDTLTLSTITGTNNKDLDGSLTLNGATAGDGAGLVRLFGASTITNNGLFAAHAPLTFQGMICCSPTLSRFINTGTLSSLPLLPGVNSRVRFDGVAFEQRGVADAAANAILELSIAPSSFAAGSSFSGAGRTMLLNTSATATLTGAVALRSGTTLELGAGAELDGTGSLTGGGTFEWSGGELRGILKVAAPTATRIVGANQKRLATGFGGGQLTLAGPTTAAAAGAVELVHAATLINTGTFTAAGPLQVLGTTCCTPPVNRLVNKGTFVARPGAGALVNIVAARYENSGQLRIESGTLQARLAGYQQTAGRTLLAGGSLGSDRTIAINGGTLAGVGTVAAPLTNAALISPGPISPPKSSGTLEVTGNYQQTPSGTLRADLRGPLPSSGHDQLRVGGAASLAGTLDLVNDPAFVPTRTARLTVLPAASRTGEFGTVLGASRPGNLRYWVSYAATPGATLGVVLAFPGANQVTAGQTPPDTSVVRTASSVLETTNSALRLMTPAGVLRQNKSLASFFGTAAADGTVFDPKLAFDRVGPDQRVYVVALQQSGTSDATGKSKIWLAVSRSANPLTLNKPTDWCTYPAINGKRNAGTAQSSWADFPGIGFGADSLLISSDQVTFGASETAEKFTFSVVRAVNKLTLSHNTAACPPAPAVRTIQPSTVLNDQSVRRLQAVGQQSLPAPSAGTGNPAYLVNAMAGSSSNYRIWRLRNVAGGAPVLDSATLTATVGYAEPANAPQSGGLPLQDTGDGRITSAAGQGNVLTFAHTTACTVAGTSQSCGRVLQVTVGQNAAGALTAVQSRLLTLTGAQGDFLIYPGVAVNASGSLGVVMLRTSATRFLGSVWTLVGPATPPEPLMTLTNGGCTKTTARAGDFTGAALSPAGDSFWLAGEHAALLGGICQWSTTVAEVVP